MNYEQIGAALKARVEQCTVALGAETDLGVKVYRGRRNISDDLMPCAVLVEGDTGVKERRGGRGGRATEYALVASYAVHAYVRCDPNNPNIAAHAALRDLKRQVFVDSDLGRQVKDVEFTSTDIAPRVDGAAFVLAMVMFEVAFHEELSAA